MRPFARLITSKYGAANRKKIKERPHNAEREIKMMILKK